MNGKLKRNVFCFFMAIMVMINIMYNSCEVVLANGTAIETELLSEEEEPENENQTDKPITEQESEDQEQPEESVSEGEPENQEQPEESVSEEEPENQDSQDEPVSGEEAENPSDKPVSEGEVQNLLDDSSSDAETEGEVTAEMDDNPAAYSVYTMPADHSLSTVYWNTSADNELSGTGQIVQYGGNDSNNGSSLKTPVKTFSAAILKAAPNAVIYNMNYEGISTDTTLDTGFYDNTVQRYGQHTGNIFQVANAGTPVTLKLSNITLDGSNSYENPVLTVGQNGNLEIGEGVGNVGDTYYFIEEKGNTIKLTGRPLSDTMYHLQFAAGYFTNSSHITTTTNGNEVLLVDASTVNLNPLSYFSVESLPDDWEAYVKNGNQLWARMNLPYTEIWLDGVNGNDELSGKTKDEAVKTYEKAYELYQEKKEEMGRSARIVVCGRVVVDHAIDVHDIVIARDSSLTGAIFQVTAEGSLAIGTTTSINGSGYAIYTAGILKVDASADIDGSILLLDPAKPMELTGTGTEAFSIGLSSAHKDGDLIVKNGASHVFTLLQNKFLLEEIGTDVYLKSPVQVWVNGITGSDSNDGLSDATPVKTYEKAYELYTTKMYGQGSIFVTGTITIDHAVEMQNVSLVRGNFYDKSLIQVTASGSLRIDESVVIDEARFSHYDSMESVGELIIAGGAVINQRIRLTDRTKPMELTGEAVEDRRFFLAVEGNFAGEDCVVRNGKSHQVKLIEGKFLLQTKEEDEHVYLKTVEEPVGIYLAGTGGNDGNDGATATTGVATFQRAKELLLAAHENGHDYDIIVCGAVEIRGEEVWELEPEVFTWNPKLIRYWNYKRDMIYLGNFMISNDILTLKNIVIDGNKEVESTGSIINCSDASLNLLEGCVLQNNNVDTSLTASAIHGAAVDFSAAGESFYVNGATIQGNKFLTDKFAASSIHIGESTTVTIEDVEMCDNIAQQTSESSTMAANGAAIYNEGTLTIKNGYFSGNEAKFGGAVYNKGSLLIENGTFENNRALYGGAIYNYRSVAPNFEINSINVNHNEAVNSGGAIVGYVKMNGGKIYENTARIGGAISGFGEINGGEIYQNTARESGGAIYLGTSTLEMNGGKIYQNTAGDRGGGIFIKNDPSGFHNYVRFISGEICENEASYGKEICIASDETRYSITAGPYISFGDTLIGGGEITLGDNGRDISKITLDAAITDAARVYSLDVSGSEKAVDGAVVVAPDGSNVTNAAQYLRNFTLTNTQDYILVKSGVNIVLGHAYFVDGVNGSDSNSGKNPANAFKTVEKTITALGTKAGNIYICGTVTIEETRTYEMQDDQAIVRYTGESVNGGSYEAFRGNMFEVTDAGALELKNVTIEGSVSGTDLDQNGYILVQGGTFQMSGDSICENGVVLIKDEKKIQVSSAGAELLAEVEKENPAVGDLIGTYVDAGAGHASTDNFKLAESMAEYVLVVEGDNVKLAEAAKVYIDGRNGEDSNDGRSPDHAVQTLKQAYTLLAATGGILSVVDTVPVTQDTSLSPMQYDDAAGSVTISGRVSVLRYIENTNTLFSVESGVFSLEDIRIDGEGEAQQHSGYVNESPLIEVKDTGRLELKGDTRLCHNVSNGTGGGICNQGIVDLYATKFEGNEAQKGSAIYQNGTLNIYGDTVDCGTEEIYLGEDKFITVKAMQKDTSLFYLNLDASNTENGRVIAKFDSGTYEAGKVMNETDHFTINTAATTKSLFAQGESMLVLSEFGARLVKDEFFQKIGSTINVNAIFTNARPQDVTVEIRDGSQLVSIAVTNTSWGKKIAIPLKRENIGTLQVSFQSNGAVVTRPIEISGYEIFYAEGQSSLIAKAQDDAKSERHQDQAKIMIYNGSVNDKIFQAGEASIGYDDAADVYVNEIPVEKEMPSEQAQKYFETSIEEETVVPGGSSAVAILTLYNGDHIFQEKTGNITLSNCFLGESGTDVLLDF